MIDLSTLMRTDPNAGIQTLLSEYGGLAYVTVRRVLKGYPEDDVEACVSDVFYYLYRHRRRLDFSDAAFPAYLIRIAEHKALDLKRKSARTPIPSEDALWNETASERSAEEEAIALLSHDELIARIRALGEPDASILLAKYWLGMTSVQIGERLDMKPNTVVQRTKRALKKIREAWKGEES